MGGLTFIDHMHVLPERYCDYFHEQKHNIDCININVTIKDERGGGGGGGGGGGVITTITPPTPSSAPPTSLDRVCSS